MARKFFSNRRKKEPDADKFCFEEPQSIETRRAMEYFDRKFKLILVLSVIYGLFFVNFIDIVTMGSEISIYHLWLFILYFMPFVMITWIFPRNWPLTLGLGLIASLMNDVFYGFIRVAFGVGLPFSLAQYYAWWLIPSDHFLFTANLGFTMIPIYSWAMALSIYGRISIVLALLWVWKKQTKKRCLTSEEIEKSLKEFNRRLD